MAESKLGSQEVNETNFVAIRNFYKDIFLQKGTYLVCIVIYLQSKWKSYLLGGLLGALHISLNVNIHGKKHI